MVDGNTTSCYTFHVSPASWYDAIRTCKSESIASHLVSVNSRKEQQVLVDTIQNDAGMSKNVALKRAVCMSVTCVRKIVAMKRHQLT